MKPLGLWYKNIDMCPNFCILYLENTELTECRICEHARYISRIGKGRTLVAYRKFRYFSITPTLQRLFISPKTTKHIAWHHLYNMVDRVMVHSFDGEAWKHFNRVHPQSSVESRNMHLGLCTDKFIPFKLFVAPYSCWSAILAVYNLAPRICMRSEFMFLSMVIPDPNSPIQNIDVYLHPLIDELKQLWLSKALTYNVSRKQNFRWR
jgi:hypothetical protein